MEQSLITNRDFIIVGQQAWEVEIGSNCKNIALELSKHNRVLYVNPPLDRFTQFKNKYDGFTKSSKQAIRGKENNLLPIKKNLWNLYPDCVMESINWVKNHFLFDTVNKWNNIRYAKSILKAVEILNFKNYILFNDNDIFRCFYLINLLKPVTGIYYSRDYLLGVDYWKYHGKYLEPKLIKKNDICVSNSSYLTDYCKKYNPKSYFVGQGCDLELYTDFAKEPATGSKPKKITIGYSGALLNLRLDIDMLLFTAKSKPEWDFVLVGPEDNDFLQSELHQLKNVIFLGLKEVSELPQYIDAVDVCINPQLINETTVGNYPRKIDEYLALGKPVVAVKTEAMDMFKAHIYLAENREMFLQQISRALAEDTPEKQQERKNFALSHSWENSIQKVYNAINDFEKELISA